MNNSEFIKRLSTDLKPVSPFSFLKQWILLLAVAVISIGLYFSVVHRREDLKEVLGGWVFWSKQLLLFGNTLLASYFIANQLTPEGMASRDERKINWKILSFVQAILLGQFALILMGNFEKAQWLSVSDNTLHCSLSVLAGAILIIAVMYFQLRRFAVTQFRSVAAWSTVFAVSSSAIVINLACSNDHPIHVYGAHVMIPSGVLFVALLASLKRALKW